MAQEPNRSSQNLDRKQPGDTSVSANRQTQSERRRARARRRAQAEMLARQQAEAEAENERRRQTIIGIVAVVVVIALIATIGGIVGYNIYKRHKANSLTMDQAYSQLQQVRTKPSTANKQGGLLFSREGYGKKAPGAPTMEIYMDPLCPWCGELHRQVGPTLEDMVNAGQINLVYHPMNFEDNLSTDNYSTRAAGALVYISAHDPNQRHLMDFIDNIYSKDFQPEEGSGYVPTGNDKIKTQALKAGVPQSVADKAFSGTYNDWLHASYQYTVRRPELWNTSGQAKGSLSTPTIVINGQRIDMSQVPNSSSKQKTLILKSLGLNESQVGVEGEMPDIGTEGKPESMS